MSNQALVAVTQRVDLISDRGERRDALDQRISEWLCSAGFVPVPIPNRFGRSADSKEGLGQWLAAVNPHSIVLSGGNEIGEMMERDQTESFLLDYAKAKRMPLLGICRGMQMMAVWAGGALSRVNGHVRTRHVLQIPPQSGLLPREVNSFHDWGLTDCPPGFAVIARAPDEEIEAIRHSSLPWEGWMWHPEREIDPEANETLRLRQLFRLETVSL